MRNLKRVLSLALASVMLMGMMVIGAGAAEAKKPLTDLDKVVNKEAVNLNVDLGIITGRDSGAFDPTGLISRSEMAALIFRTLEASNDASLYVGAGSNFKDVVKGHWAAGYINYAASLKIVLGKDIGFDPDGKVKVVEAAKMLLVSLGYNSKLSKYENDENWAINIMKDAKKAGLLNGVTQKTMDELTRDNAAQMIFNTLFSYMVEPDTQRDMGVEYLRKYDPIKDAQGNKIILGADKFNLAKVTGTLVATGTAALNGTPVGKGEIKLAGKNAVKLAGSADLLGQDVVYYTGKDGKILSAAIVATGDSEITTDTKGTTFAKFIKDNNLDAAAAQYSDYTKLDATNTIGNPNAGDVVKYIDVTGDGTVDYIIRAVYKLSKVTKTTAASGSTKATISVQGEGTFNSDEIEGVDDLKKDDLVLYTRIGNVLLAERPATVEGTISSFKGGDTAVTDITVDGTSYKTSSIALANLGVTNGATVHDTATASSLLKSSGTFYLDKSGAVAYYVKKTEGKSSYAYVLQAKKTPAGFGSEGDDTYSAYVILSDGTKATYELTKTSKFGKDNWATDATGAGLNGNVFTAQGVQNLYKYTINADNKMTLTAAANTGFVAPVTHVKVNKNGAQFKSSTDNFANNDVAVVNAFLNKDTVFMFYAADATGKPVTMITGYENIPTSTKVAFNKVSYVKNSKNEVEIVYVETAPITVSAKAYAYATGEDAETTSDGVKYEFIIDGKIENLLVSAADATYDKDVLYTYVTDNKGVSTLTKVSGTASVVANAKVTTIASNYIIVNNTTVVYLGKDYTVDSALKLDKPTVGSLAVGDTITYAVDSDGKLVKAYVVPTVELAAVRVAVSGSNVSASLVGASNGTATYAWTVTGGNGTGAAFADNTAASTAVTITNTAAGTYTVNVEVTVTYTSRTGVILTDTAAGVVSITKTAAP